MYRIGIDVGSTYTKYCVEDTESRIQKLWAEETPVRQKEYFGAKVESLLLEYPDARIVSCGYGKENVQAVKNINELTALAYGCRFLGNGRQNTVLDIGGQDTKLILHQDGKLKEFFVNEKCAAGCGIFLANTLHLLKMCFRDIDLRGAKQPHVRLSSVCAVFAQSEIVQLLAQGCEPEELIRAVVWQILSQAKVMLTKIDCGQVMLSGGIAQIPGILEYAGKVFGIKTDIPEHAAFLAAIGCAGYCN